MSEFGYIFMRRGPKGHDGTDPCVPAPLLLYLFFEGFGSFFAFSDIYTKAAFFFMQSAKRRGFFVPVSASFSLVRPVSAPVLIRRRSLLSFSALRRIMEDMKRTISLNGIPTVYTLERKRVKNVN